MTRNATLFREVGLALYGRDWAFRLSRDLDVNPRTLRRWANGEFTIPESIWPEVGRVCEREADTLTKWAERLKT